MHRFCDRLLGIIEWQFKVTVGCDRHQLRLLSECPNCKARFAVPALWVEGACLRCFTTFGEMARWQKVIEGDRCWSQ